MVQHPDRLRFHSPDDGGERIFVHRSGIADDGSKFLENGEKVTYEAVRGS